MNQKSQMNMLTQSLHIYLIRVGLGDQMKYHTIDLCYVMMDVFSHPVFCLRRSFASTK